MQTVLPGKGVRISPSVLACDLSRLEQEATAMAAAGAELLHLDVMDGHFVPNITFGAPVIKSLRPATALYFDTHLMIAKPLRYIDDFARAGADMITFHIESDDDPAAVIERIRNSGKHAGLVLKPATAAKEVFPYLDRIDMVLVMTVEPGFGGQAFQPEMMPKLAELRAEIDRRGLHVALEVDGGIDEHTAPVAVRAGANVLVAGSSLFSKEDYAAAVAGLRRAAAI